MHPALIVLLTVLGVLVLEILLLFLLAGGNTRRLGLALRGGLRILQDQAVADKVEPLLVTVAAKPPTPPKPSGAPLRLLRLLQRDGRFLDFVLDDVQQADNEQIVAAVRAMQPQWQSTIKKHLVLEPVRSEPEGSEVEVPVGFDPSAVQVTGNVTGSPPFRGILRHGGWRVQSMNLPPLPEGQDEFVVMPAEVELPGAETGNPLLR